jgi:hypothetical protein
MPTLRLLPELEEALRLVPGIRAASVVTGPDAVPTEVHIVASRSKGAKQVVRDVQSLALAGYDIDIDHRIVSVVQIDEGDGPALRLAIPPSHAGTDDGLDLTDVVAPPLEAAPRPLVDAVVVRTSHSEAEVTVTLAFGGDVFIGSASGSSAIASRPRLVARATLDALGELLGTPADIEHSTVLPVGSRSVAVSVLQVQVPRTGEQVLSGSAVVRGDESDAVARSVLDALNRRLIG